MSSSIVRKTEMKNQRANRGEDAVNESLFNHLLEQDLPDAKRTFNNSSFE